MDNYVKAIHLIKERNFESASKYIDPEFFKLRVNQKTPLIWALTEQDLSVVEFLVSKGADIDEKNEYDEDAISEAYEENKYDIVDFLIKHKAKMNGEIPPVSVSSDFDDFSEDIQENMGEVNDESSSRGEDSTIEVNDASSSSVSEISDINVDENNTEEISDYDSDVTCVEDLIFKEDMLEQDDKETNECETNECEKEAIKQEQELAIKEIKEIQDDIDKLFIG